MTSAIQISQLVHTYKTDLFKKPKHALRGLDLSVEPGESYGYLGTNGAGKTTTIKALVGLLQQTSGTARIFDIDTREVRARALVGFQPENPYFYEYLTAREALDFYAALCKLPRAQRRTRSDELLEFVGLTEAADTRIGEYSKGMRQRLGIAQAVIHRPKLVILDEPMSGLDPLGRLQVRAIITELHQQGLTVFFSSHILSDVEMICDRVGLLMNGVLHAVGPVNTLLEARLRGIVITAEGLTEKAASTLDATTSEWTPPGTCRLQCADASIRDKVLRNILDAGGTITSVTPLTETLEEYFMRVNHLSRDKVGAWKGGADA